MRVNDQEALIPGKEPRINPIAFYFIIQLLPYLVFILFILLKIQILHTTIVTLILLGINFWFIKNVHGIQLVGLRWKISLLSGFEFYSKPNPFVPRAIDSNSFWVGFFIFIFLWIIAFIISLFLKESLLCLVCFIGFLSEIINLMMFMRSYRSAKSQAEHAALEILQDETVNFELVHSDDEEHHNENVNNDIHDVNAIDNNLNNNNIENNNNLTNASNLDDVNDNVDFYNSNDVENENSVKNEKDQDANSQEFDLPTFDMPDDNENDNSGGEEPVHFDLVDEKDD